MENIAQEQAQAPAPLTQDQLDALRKAEADLSADLQQVAEDTKRRANQVTPELLSVIEETQRRTYVRDMAQLELSRELFAQDARLARVFAVSGVFGDIKGTSPAQAIAAAMTKIRLGRSWGLNEADSMQFIYFTNGRPSVMAEMIAARLQDAGWDWDIRWYETNNRCTGCGLFPKRRNAADQFEYLQEIDPTDPEKKRARNVEIKFTKEDADKAFIWEKGKQIVLSDKWNFKSWPGDMYFARCIVRLKRRYAPNILKGALLVEEAQEIAPRGVETPSAADTRGSIAAAEEVAQRRIAELGGQWQETETERDARIDQQIADQTEEARRKVAAGPEQQTLVEAPPAQHAAQRPRSLFVGAKRGQQ